MPNIQGKNQIISRPDRQKWHGERIFVTEFLGINGTLHAIRYDHKVCMLANETLNTERERQVDTCTHTHTKHYNVRFVYVKNFFRHAKISQAQP